MEWADANDDVVSTTTQTLDGGAIDAEFRTVEFVITAPSGSSSLRRIGIEATGLNPTATGLFAYIDDVNVFVEPRDIQYLYPFDQAFRRQLSGTGVVLTDKNGDFASQAPASIRFDSTTPAGEGQLVVESGDSTALPPSLNFPGRLYNLGTELLDSSTDALKARVGAPYGVAAGISYTLMWESPPVSGASLAVARIYVDTSGSSIFTNNAKWGAGQWNPDVNQSATKTSVSSTGLRVQHRNTVTALAPWLDTAWDGSSIIGAVNGTSVNPAFQVLDSAGNIRSAIDHIGFPNQRIITKNSFWDQAVTTTGPTVTVEPGWIAAASGTQAAVSAGDTNSFNPFSCGSSLSVNPGTDFPGSAFCHYAKIINNANNNSDANLMISASFSVYILNRGSNQRTFIVGLSENATLVSHNNICFSLSGSNANWQSVVSSHTSGDSFDTGIAATDGTAYDMRIECQGTGYPGGYSSRFFINDVLVASDSTAGSRPSGNAMQFWIYSANTASAVGLGAGIYVSPVSFTFAVPNNITSRKV